MDIACLLGLDAADLIMTLQAAFDESGKYADCERVVFGGLIFDPSSHIMEFNRAWGTLLRSSGVKLPQGRLGDFLHMVELNRLHKLSSGDRSAQEKIEKFAESLAKCICEFALGGSLNTITVADFKALPDEMRRRQKDPFYHAFEAGVMALSRHPCVGPQDDIALCCDDSDDAVKCLQSFKKLKRLEASVVEKIPFIGFGDDKVFPPLQAADMFAYCYRAKVSSPDDGLWTAPLEIMLSTFSEHTPGDILLGPSGDIIRS